MRVSYQGKVMRNKIIRRYPSSKSVGRKEVITTIKAQHLVFPLNRTTGRVRSVNKTMFWVSERLKINNRSVAVFNRSYLEGPEHKHFERWRVLFNHKIGRIEGQLCFVFHFINISSKTKRMFCLFFANTQTFLTCAFLNARKEEQNKCLLEKK